MLNKVGRRHQLAFELVQQVPWLNRAAVPRIAWVARHLADAGWTVSEVIAWLELGAASSNVKRPSAFLAHRLHSAEQVWDTAAKRAGGVEAWRESHRVAAARHTEWQVEWTVPATQRACDEVAAATAAPAYRTAAEEAGATVHGCGDRIPGLEEYTRDQVLDLRTVAALVPAIVLQAIEERGEDFARLLYTNDIVNRLLRESSLFAGGGGA